ncbi:MAG: hypothetical protein E6713_13980 [Sporomusaceae bacterium]|nr:hypothetical protein [Sporomusaceae bacterium]
MKRLSDIIFWSLTILWLFTRQTTEDSTLKTVTDVALTIAASISLFNYGRRYRQKKEEQLQKSSLPKRTTPKRSPKKKKRSTKR